MNAVDPGASARSVGGEPRTRRRFARRLFVFACALFAVAIPDIAYAARTLADPIAYPLALSALYAAVVALERPTRRSQLAFFALACLASLARVQYVVLIAAYFAALLVTRRREALRTHRLSIGLLAGSLVLLVPGLLGLVAIVAWAIRHHRRRRHWMRLSAELARQTGRPTSDHVGDTNGRPRQSPSARISRRG